MRGTVIVLHDTTLHMEYIDWHSDDGRDIYEYYICRDKHKLIDLLTATVEAKIRWLANHLQGGGTRNSAQSEPAKLLM